MLLNIVEYENEINNASSSWATTDSFDKLISKIFQCAIDKYLNDNEISLYDSSSFVYKLKKFVSKKLLPEYYLKKDNNSSISDITDNVIQISKFLQKNKIPLFPINVTEDIIDRFKRDLPFSKGKIEVNAKFSIKADLHNYWYKMIYNQNKGMVNIPLLYKDILIAIYFLKTNSSYITNEKERYLITILSRNKIDNSTYTEISAAIRLVERTLAYLSEKVNNPNLISYNVSSIEAFKNDFFLYEQDTSELKGLSLFQLINNISFSEERLSGISFTYNENYDKCIQNGLQYIMKAIPDIYKTYLINWNNKKNEGSRKNYSKKLSLDFLCHLENKTNPLYLYHKWLFSCFLICKEINDQFTFNAFWNGCRMLKYNSLEDLQLNIQKVEATFSDFEEMMYHLISRWINLSRIPLHDTFIKKIQYPPTTYDLPSYDIKVSLDDFKKYKKENEQIYTQLKDLSTRIRKQAVSPTAIDFINKSQKYYYEKNRTLAKLEHFPTNPNKIDIKNDKIQIVNSTILFNETIFTMVFLNKITNPSWMHFN